MATKKRRKNFASSSRYVMEFQAMLDDLNEIIGRANLRGFHPSFLVTCGKIRNVSMLPVKARDIDPRGIPCMDEFGDGEDD